MSVFTLPDHLELVSTMIPKGDQPKAIEELVAGLNAGHQYQTLLGVTGSGKTFTMANVINRVQKPTLIISHNKVLAAQLYSELKHFFPNNAVGYFVSYYDYYQPEAYMPRTDTYIEKQTMINEELDRLRLAATSGLIDRRDVIIVASVSCIYGLGSPEDYRNMVCVLDRGAVMDRQKILRQLVELQYERNDASLQRGTFRVKGDVIDIFPAYEERPFRVELYGDEIEKIGVIDPLQNAVTERGDRLVIYPAKHFVTPEDKRDRAFAAIQEELREQLALLRAENRLLEAQRLEQRTMFDLEMIREIGYCQGIENYSRHLSGRKAGEPPWTLIDYFPDDFLMIIDESHMTLPQIRGMFAGDRSRKETLVKYGFRLPSALDNRPLRFDEFLERIPQAVFVSATPGDYELKVSAQVVEQIIRPTGLIDPAITVCPATGQIDDLIARINDRVAKSERVLVTTLTTRMAEDLADYLMQLGIRVQYLHHQIETLERVEIVKGLRSGDFDVIVGVNLLREGLDMPEVSLVAILDADKEGFLRSATSLIQVCGRAARNVSGEVILYADKRTDAIEKAINESDRRRVIQLAYNKEHGITPRTIQKEIHNLLEARSKKKIDAQELLWSVFEKKDFDALPKEQVIKELRKRMLQAAQSLEFEKAMVYRDKIAEIEKTKR